MEATPCVHVHYKGSIPTSFQDNTFKEFLILRPIEIHQHVTQTFHVVSSGLLYPQVSVDRGIPEVFDIQISPNTKRNIILCYQHHRR